MSDNVFAERLKSPARVEILFNCLRNTEKQMKEILVLAKSTQEQQINSERQLNDFHTSAQFISDKPKEYEEDREKKNEIIGNLQLEPKLGYRYVTPRHRKKPWNWSIKVAWRKTLSKHNQNCSI